MGSGRRSGGQHSKANHCHRAVIYPSRPSRHGSSCPTGAPTPETTTAWLVGLGRSPVSVRLRGPVVATAVLAGCGDQRFRLQIASTKDALAHHRPNLCAPAHGNKLVLDKR
jgi:hypothetical protein